ncbi:hypothetical protein [Maricaulis parjimensis]|nr:hypothetical protein [Maricaulis parjimensis]
MFTCKQVTPLVGAIIAISTALAAIAGGLSAQDRTAPAAPAAITLEAEQ